MEFLSGLFISTFLFFSVTCAPIAYADFEIEDHDSSQYSGVFNFLDCCADHNSSVDILSSSSLIKLDSFDVPLNINRQGSFNEECFIFANSLPLSDVGRSLNFSDFFTGIVFKKE